MERRWHRDLSSGCLGHSLPHSGCGRQGGQLWLGGSWSSCEDDLQRIPEPQQVWLGLTWSSAQEAPGKVSCCPFGAESLSEQELSLHSPAAQEAAV